MSYEESVEEHFFQKYRKEQRQEKKKRSRKTERERSEASVAFVPTDTMVKGRVVRLSSRGVEVMSGPHRVLLELRGSLKQKRSASRNLVAIGDQVYYTRLHEGAGVLEHVMERASQLYRVDPMVPCQKQLLAANVTMVWVVVSVCDPPLKPSLIDRYLIHIGLENLTPVLVCNKVDLLALGSAEQLQAFEMQKVYEGLGIRCVMVSSHTRQGFEELEELMQGQLCVVSGQSGVGKTSILNGLFGFDDAVKPTKKSRKGVHTTTHPVLHPVGSGFMIDTPGIKSFGVFDLASLHLPTFFPEIQEVGKACPFRDCTHVGESGCQVLEALDRGEIARSRYASYEGLVQEQKGAASYVKQKRQGQQIRREDR